MTQKTSVIGFPRIGKNRELKFASEKYFKKEISADELEKIAADLRAYGWKKQADAEISFIPSNDFSFYDNMLDTAFLLEALPARYKALGLSPLETYFAAAHGYQGKAGDVKALPMKKWFNTNYHYIVPELSDDMKLAVSTQNKALSEFKEAKSLGIQTIPSLIGPYTFLHLATYTGSKKALDFAGSAAAAYLELAKSLSDAGAEWISLAEPALVFDISSKEKDLFISIYKELISKLHTEAKIKISLQTYFGDIRDVYKEVCELGFDAIGLDFIEGKNSLELVKSGFPQNTLLLAGLINGKNIWRADYQNKINLLEEIKKTVAEENIVIGTSCSLLHVPYTTASEEKLTTEILEYFSFAEEKIQELKELASRDTTALEANKKLFAKQRVAKDETVQNSLAKITEADFVRKPDFA